MLKHVEGSMAGPSGLPGDEAHQGAARRRRKANFSAEEVDILVREVAARRHILFGGGQNGRSDVGNAAAKATEKLAAWRAVATNVNSANRGEPRTVREIRKKWENVTSTFRKRQLGDLGAGIEIEPHLLAGSRCPSDEVLACARAYQANRLMHQQRRNATASTASTFHNEDGRADYSSSEDDLILDIQPDVHIESLETPLTFTDSDDVNSINDISMLSKVKSENVAHDSSDGDHYQGNHQFLQLKQQLRSGEVVIRPAVAPAELVSNGRCRKRNRSSPDPAEASTSSSAAPQSIEEQKLAVMKQLLKVETKRLKVEKKRLKIEKIRLRMLHNE